MNEIDAFNETLTALHIDVTIVKIITGEHTFTIVFDDEKVARRMKNAFGDRAVLSDPVGGLWYVTVAVEQ